MTNIVIRLCLFPALLFAGGCDRQTPEAPIPGEGVTSEPQEQLFPLSSTRSDTHLLRTRVAGVLFEIPRNEIGGMTRPRRQGGDVEHIALNLRWEDRQLHGFTDELPVIAGDSVEIAIEGVRRITPYGSDPPDWYVRTNAGPGWSGPYNAGPGVVEYRLKEYPSSDARVYALTDLRDRYPDGTIPAITCYMQTCRASNHRLDPILAYGYEFPRRHLGEWREIHYAVRAQIAKRRKS